MKFKLTSPTHKSNLIDYINTLPENKIYEVDIVLYRKKRTLPSNCLYWLWIKCISDETGNDKDDLHDFFKQKFIGFTTKEIKGTTVYKPPSTAELNTLQFKEFLDNISAFAGSELGIILPCPEDLIFEQFYEQYRDRL